MLGGGGLREAQIAALHPDRIGIFAGEPGKPGARGLSIAEREAGAAQPEQAAIALGERPLLDQLRDLPQRLVGRALRIGAEQIEELLLALLRVRCIRQRRGARVASLRGCGSRSGEQRQGQQDDAGELRGAGKPAAQGKLVAIPILIKMRKDLLGRRGPLLTGGRGLLFTRDRPGARPCAGSGASLPRRRSLAPRVGRVGFRFLRGRSSTASFARRRPSAAARFWVRLRWSLPSATTPLGACTRRMAVSTLLRCCPPGPPARCTWISHCASSASSSSRWKRVGAGAGGAGSMPALSLKSARLSFQSRGAAPAAAAAPSISRARARSRAVVPPASWLDKVKRTFLNSICMSGW